jgi:hypothetical protein
MATKSMQGQVNKYSDVVKSVKNTSKTPKTPEEPKMNPEEIVHIFRSFGFEPNERGLNDVGYWSTRGQSEKPKLFEELRQRRMEIIKREDEAKNFEENRNRTERESKSTLPRLSDEEITSLFDEYGLPTPDPERVRNNLPNDPKKIRAILEVQRKAMDDMIKKQTRNSVNELPETPRQVPQQMSQPNPQQMMGMGGPTPMGTQNEMMPQEAPMKPFFVGEHSLVRITNPTNPNSSTLWLVDAKKKVLRPFLSEQAFQNAFEDPQGAEKNITTISTKELGPGGVLEDFTLLQAEKGVKEDGSMDEIEFSPAQLKKRYGKPSDPAAEQKSLAMLDGFLGNLNKQQ